MQPVGHAHFGGQSFHGLQRGHGVILPAFAGFKYIGAKNQVSIPHPGPLRLRVILPHNPCPATIPNSSGCFQLA